MTKGSIALDNYLSGLQQNPPYVRDVRHIFPRSMAILAQKPPHGAAKPSMLHQRADLAKMEKVFINCHSGGYKTKVTT